MHLCHRHHRHKLNIIKNKNKIKIETSFDISYTISVSYFQSFFKLLFIVNKRYAFAISSQLWGMKKSWQFISPQTFIGTTRNLWKHSLSDSVLSTTVSQSCVLSKYVDFWAAPNANTPWPCRTEMQIAQRLCGVKVFVINYWKLHGLCTVIFRRLWRECISKWCELAIDLRNCCCV